MVVLGKAPSTSRKRSNTNVVPSKIQIVDSTLGRLLVVASERGIQAVAFADRDEGFAEFLSKHFSKSDESAPNSEQIGWVEAIRAFVDGEGAMPSLPVDCLGTPFQNEVWQQLRQIPAGTTISYRTLAERLGRPSGVRAVARACGANLVAVLVPCHRVVGSDGSMTGYRWGVKRKEKLLERESGTR